MRPNASISCALPAARTLRGPAVAILALALGFVAAAGVTGVHGAEAAEGTGAAKVTYYTCSMHPQVMQDRPGNCPICGMKLVPMRDEAAGAGAAQGSDAQAGQGTAGEVPGKERKILYYWDPMMNPPYVADKPGKSPMGMDLVPVYEDEVRAGPTVVIDPVVTQNMGIRVAEVRRGPLHTQVRTVGYFRAAEPRQRDVTVKVAGYVERLLADTQGMLVKKGEVLAEIYSPEVVAAQQELLAAKRSLDRLRGDADAAARAEAEALLADARIRLELWDVAAGDIDAILESDEVARNIALRSPASGFVTEKNVVEGAAVAPGERLFRIVDLSVVWLDAQVYENQLPLVKLGSKASAEASGLDGKAVQGEVVFLDPQVNPETRAVTARISFPNRDFVLKPGMYAAVEIDVEAAADAIQAPREAVIDTGKRQLVFVALGGGRFDPRAVRTGAETPDGLVEILAGLAPGEQVVTSGQFLLDTESRTREAIQKMTAERLLTPADQAVRAEPAAAPEPMASAAAADLTAQVDAVVTPYLEIASLLAADIQPSDSEVQALAQAATALAAAVGTGLLEPIAKGIAESAAVLGRGGIDDQRKVFKALSDYVVKLVDHAAPSKAVGERLYVVNCPMYPGDWLQRDQEVRNPFYGKMMLTCGTVKRTIETAAAR